MLCSQLVPSSEVSNAYTFERSLGQGGIGQVVQAGRDAIKDLGNKQIKDQTGPKV